jgi:hypothetical protein
MVSKISHRGWIALPLRFLMSHTRGWWPQSIRRHPVTWRPLRASASRHCNPSPYWTP